MVTSRCTVSCGNWSYIMQSYDCEQVSNWILPSCHHVRTIKLRHREIQIAKLFSYKPLLKAIFKINPYTTIKRNTDTKIKHKFLKLVPSILPLLKEHIWLRSKVDQSINTVREFLDKFKARASFTSANRIADHQDCTERMSYRTKLELSNNVFRLF